jgi:hypothetical protein
MELTSINEHVRSEERDSLILQSYDARGRELVLAFTCDGGRREDEALVVRFHDAALFHLRPSSIALCSSASPSRKKPSVSFLQRATMPTSSPARAAGSALSSSRTEKALRTATTLRPSVSKPPGSHAGAREERQAAQNGDPGSPPGTRETAGLFR